ncbi:MAG: DUF1524 domain-containing protein [Agathobacter sp.]|nr:DUF1524 domain-containing protein [Agathobacter sp.]
MLKALYDESREGTLRAKIQNNYLLNPIENSKMKLKLKPIKKDEGVYKKLLSHYRVDSEAFSAKEMETPLFQAFSNFKVWIQELRDIEDYEHRLMTAIENLEVIEIIVTAENPQEIFESLNATGMTLTNVDILRNYLLMSVPYKEQVRLYNTYWMPIEEAVTSDELQQFVCSYLVLVRQSDEFNINGKKWKVNPGNLCLCFREHYPYITDVDELDNLLADIYKYSQYYKRFIYDKNTNPAILSDVDAVIYELFGTLKDIGFKPLVLYLFEQLSNGIITNEQMKQIVRIIISYVFRNYACGRKASFGYQFSGFIIKRLAAYDGTEDYVRLFKKAMSSGHGQYAFPSDVLFEHALVDLTLSSWAVPKIKYLLYSIEKELNPSQTATITAGTIEHIMPQTLSDAWAKYLAFNGDAGMHDEKLNALGNLTLSESNSALGNKSFEEKKAIYSNSIYRMTRDIKDVGSWTQNIINKRSKELCKVALKIWPGAGNQQQTEDNFIKYSLSSDLSKLVSAPPTSFCFLGEEVPVNSWNALGCGVVSILYSVSPDSIMEILENNPMEIDGLISKAADGKKQYSRIADGIWLNQAKRPLSVLKQLRILLDMCSTNDHSLCDELWFTILEPDDEDDIITMV